MLHLNGDEDSIACNFLNRSISLAISQVPHSNFQLGSKTVRAKDNLKGRCDLFIEVSVDGTFLTDLNAIYPDLQDFWGDDKLG